MITVHFPRFDVQAVLQEDGIWTCENKTLKDLLNAQFQPEDGAEYDPDPMLTAAEYAAEILGGAIVEGRQDPVDGPADAIY